MTTWREGSQFGDYELLHRLGGGGFGEVWLARKAGAEPVALKILHGQHQSGEAVRIRAEIELLAAAASSRSAHIVRVLDGGSQPAPHVVMEYIDGVDLGGEITSRGALPVPEVLKVADAIADALSTLQLLGIIHRDVKPANVMIDTQGIVKLTDFGIAKIVGIDTVTATSQMPMSMAYAAPEVWEGKASHLSDHYAFGALLYQCLVGRPPFGGSYAEIYRHHLMTTPDLSALPSNTPASLSSLIGECLAKDPAQRPQTATALHNAVSAALREMAADQAATVVQARLQEPKKIGPWIIDSRENGSGWTFVCHHETSGEQALVEVIFADDLEYGQILRQIVSTRRELLSTSRFILRPGEGFIGAPAGLFLYWLAHDPAPEPAITRMVSLDVEATQVQSERSGVTQVASAATPLEIPSKVEIPSKAPEPAPVVERPVAPFTRATPTSEPPKPDLVSWILLLDKLAGPWDLVFRAVFYIGVCAGIAQVISALGAGLTIFEFLLQTGVLVGIPIVALWVLARFGPFSGEENAASSHLSLLHWPQGSAGRLGHIIGVLLWGAYVASFVALYTSSHNSTTVHRVLAVFGLMVLIPIATTVLHLIGLTATNRRPSS